jgi:hypothetical protein
LALVLTATFAGCGGGDDVVVVTGPGFVGIDDSVAGTAPLLTVDFVDPVLVPGTALILSDRPSDGDIAFDPVRSVFTVTTNTTPLFFGIDSFDPNLPEFRAFWTFPLDGFEGRDVVPSGATITSATVEFFITEVSFANVVPTFMDLIQYGFQNLQAGDFSAPVIDFRTLDFLFTDEGNFVLIDVTPLMQTAQAQNLLDFQIRFSLDSVAAAGPQVARPQAVQKKVDRSVSPTSRAVKRPARTPQAGGSAAGTAADRPARSR